MSAFACHENYRQLEKQIVLRRKMKNKVNETTRDSLKNDEKTYNFVWFYLPMKV